MKTWIDSIRQVKISLVVAAVFIAVVSLVVSHKLIRDLQNEELAKMEIWAEAMRSLISADETTDLNLVLKIINSNNTIPIIVTDKEGHVTTQRNLVLNTSTEKDSLQSLDAIARDMKQNADRMILCIEPSSELGVTEAENLYIYYTDSLMLRRLAFFPYVQLGVVGLFVLVAVFALLSSKRAEQNKVWVGLSKETAHQLGTPISSLMAWTAVLEDTYPDENMIVEMKDDVKRLELIAERFSKIGSVPELKDSDLCAVINNIVVYISRRTCDSVKMNCHFPSVKGPARESVQSIPRIVIPMCAPLMEWVIEVLCKNAVDAMAGVGEINVLVKKENKSWIVEISDTGKGIPHKNFNLVFKPGFTTKQRGWGLGLSLARRIIEEYHHGRIFVKSSDIGKGTTFRIELHQ